MPINVPPGALKFTGDEEPSFTKKPVTLTLIPFEDPDTGEMFLKDAGTGAVCTNLKVKSFEKTVAAYGWDYVLAGWVSHHDLIEHGGPSYGATVTGKMGGGPPSIHELPKAGALSPSYEKALKHTMLYGGGPKPLKHGMAPKKVTVDPEASTGKISALLDKMTAEIMQKSLMNALSKAGFSAKESGMSLAALVEAYQKPLTAAELSKTSELKMIAESDYAEQPFLDMEAPWTGAFTKDLMKLPEKPKIMGMDFAVTKNAPKDTVAIVQTTGALPALPPVKSTGLDHTYHAMKNCVIDGTHYQKDQLVPPHIGMKHPALTYTLPAPKKLFGGGKIEQPKIEYVSLVDKPANTKPVTVTVKELEPKEIDLKEGTLTDLKSGVVRYLKPGTPQPKPKPAPKPEPAPEQGVKLKTFSFSGNGLKITGKTHGNPDDFKPKGMT